MKKAKDVMTENPNTCLAEESLYDATKIMELNNCGAVPIVDQEGKPCGIITDRDIALYLGLCQEAINPQEVKIAEVMSESPITCHPDDDLQTIIRMMKDNQVRRIPVVNSQGRCVGIIAQADVILEGESHEMAFELVEEISK